MSADKGGDSMKSGVKRNLKSRTAKERLFATGILMIPLLWWAFGFFYTTGDSILLAFKKYNADTESFISCGFENFSTVFKDMFEGGLLGVCFKNSFILWSLNTFLILPINVMMSYALYKKIRGHKMFTVLMFLPQIVSSMVWILIYKYFIEYGYPILSGYEGISLLKNPETDYLTLVIYQIWISLASGMIIYTGAMSRIPPQLTEAGKLDGLSDFGELIYIVLPLIFPTISVVLITCVMGIFTSSLPTYQFYGGLSIRDGLYTFGHYMFAYVVDGNTAMYPMVSAVSFIVCMVAAPVTFLIKHLLEKVSGDVEF